MREHIINIPNDFEVKEIKDGKIILVEKEKKLTYKDIIEQLFPITKIHYFVNSAGIISSVYNCMNNRDFKTNATSERQLEKLLAINMLMNVAKYLNDGWQPNWNNNRGYKYFIRIDNNDYIFIDFVNIFKSGDIYFKSKELVEQAIEILGEETIRLALCTDY